MSVRRESPGSSWRDRASCSDSIAPWRETTQPCADERGRAGQHFRRRLSLRSVGPTTRWVAASQLPSFRGGQAPHVWAPSTTTFSPVTWAHRGDRRHATTEATSDGWAMTPLGIFETIWWRTASSSIPLSRACAASKASNLPVATGPGLTQFTAIPSGAISLASAPMTPTSAEFIAAEVTSVGSGAWDEFPATITTDPPPPARSAGIAARTARSVARNFVVTAETHTSSVRDEKLPSGVEPTHVTRPWTAPNSSLAR